MYDLCSIYISRASPNHVAILARNARKYGKFSNEFPVNNCYVLLDGDGSPSSMASLHGEVSENKLGRMASLPPPLDSSLIPED